ncbi:MAG: hypothetical protein CMJ78_02195 [Planctomycetaceae bacterium]|nr:hypothetical protein [Planctomycetaceae bacterium]
MWQLQPHEKEDPFVAIAHMQENEPTTFEVDFETARFLRGGVNSLGSLAGDDDLQSQTPFSSSNRPTYSLATLSFSPGEYMGCDLVLLDADKKELYTWEAFPGFSITSVQLMIIANLKPSLTIDFIVSGVMDIDGHSFEVACDPGESIRGTSIHPHQFSSGDAKTFLEKLFGDALTFPNLNLKLLSAEYYYDKSGGRRYQIAVGGKIDLLGNCSLVLSELGFEYENDGTSTLRKLTGTMLIAKNVVMVTGEYQTDTAWQFEGSILTDQPISLNDLADEALQTWDAALPDAVPEIDLYYVMVRFGLKPRFFECSARATWKLPDYISLSIGTVESVVTLTAAKKIAAKAAEFAQHALKGAEEAAKAVFKEAAKAVKAIEQAAKEVWNDVKELGKKLWGDIKI